MKGTDMKDDFKRVSYKSYVSCGFGPGDGWNALGYGHTKRRKKGRDKIHRAARMKLKEDLRRQVAMA